MKLTYIAAALAAVSAIPTAAQADPFGNGSFETLATGRTAPGSGSLDTFYAPSDAIAGWTVSSGSVDYIDTGYWQASDGRFSLDMSGASAGTIQQLFDTVAGRTYSVLFDLSKNPTSALATLRVAAGGLSQDYSFGLSNNNSNMMWSTRSFSFVAQGASSTLSFTSLDGGVSGPALDNVRVAAVGVAGAVPEPASWALMILGFGAMGAVVRRRTRIHAIATA